MLAPTGERIHSLLRTNNSNHEWQGQRKDKKDCMCTHWWGDIHTLWPPCWCTQVLSPWMPAGASEAARYLLARGSGRPWCSHTSCRRTASVHSVRNTQRRTGSLKGREHSSCWGGWEQAALLQTPMGAHKNSKATGEEPLCPWFLSSVPIDIHLVIYWGPKEWDVTE